LRKSLYGLKQAPQAWYAKMDSFLLSQGEGEPCKILLFHVVDDLLFTIFYIVIVLLFFPLKIRRYNLLREVKHNIVKNI
jgi:hypothetical protein